MIHSVVSFFKIRYLCLFYERRRDCCLQLVYRWIQISYLLKKINSLLINRTDTADSGTEIRWFVCYFIIFIFIFAQCIQSLRKICRNNKKFKDLLFNEQPHIEIARGECVSGLVFSHVHYAIELHLMHGLLIVSLTLDKLWQSTLIYFLFECHFNHIIRLVHDCARNF